MRERGMALLTGLLLLAAITLLALAGTSGMILQRHMSSNFKQSSTALQNAELALSEGQAWLFSRANHERETDCSTDCLLPVAILKSGALPTHIEHESEAWWQLNGVEAGVNPVTGIANSATQSNSRYSSRWIIEEVHFSDTELSPPFEEAEGVGFYRIFGRGNGGNIRSVAITEAIIARPWGDAFAVDDYPQTSDQIRFCHQLESADAPIPECGLLAWRQRR